MSSIILGKCYSPFTSFSFLKIHSMTSCINIPTIRHFSKSKIPMSINITPQVFSKIGINLHNQPNHPILIIKKLISQYFDQKFINNQGKPLFKLFDTFHPKVSVKDNFDKLNIVASHPSRQLSDTYFFDQDNILRTHTSAHQNILLSQGYRHFLVCGDCYRRDAIDNTHYPVFHQMEGVMVWSKEEIIKDSDSLIPDSRVLDNTGQESSIIQDLSLSLSYIHLKNTLIGLATHIFGDIPMRWNIETFPFTEPSLELEIFYQNKWLEILGCGCIHPLILIRNGLDHHVGWAFGLGLERWCMALFGISDIRLFWSRDIRFISQFQEGHFTKYIPFSKYPTCYKDVSFWYKETDGTSIHPNDISDIVRDTAGDLVSCVQLIDTYRPSLPPKLPDQTNVLLKIDHENHLSPIVSNCYRIHYDSMERTLSNDEVNNIHYLVRLNLQKQLKIVLR